MKKPLDAEEIKRLQNTKKRIIEENPIDETFGRVCAPGKFERQFPSVIYYWNLLMEGCCDRDDGKVAGFDVSHEERQVFPELKGRRTVNITEDDQGFVYDI